VLILILINLINTILAERNYENHFHILSIWKLFLPINFIITDNKNKISKTNFHILLINEIIFGEMSFWQNGFRQNGFGKRSQNEYLVKHPFGETGSGKWFSAACPDTIKFNPLFLTVFTSLYQL
jgi:hypothetical protein